MTFFPVQEKLILAFRDGIEPTTVHVKLPVLFSLVFDH